MIRIVLPTHSTKQPLLTLEDIEHLHAFTLISLELKIPFNIKVET